MAPSTLFHFEIRVPTLSPQEKALYRKIPSQSPRPRRTRTHPVKSEPIIKEEELDVDLIEGPVVTRQHIKDEYEARDLKVPAIKKEAIVLSEDAVQRRLQIAGCAPLQFQADPDMIKVGFTRAELSKILGGNSQMVGCHPRQSRFHMIHDVDFYLAPMREWNPHTPLGRGEPGLLIWPFAEKRSRHSAVPLFAKLPRHLGDQGFYNEKDTRWLYFGHYSMKRSEPLSTDEWNILPDHTRNLWVDGKMDDVVARAAVALYSKEKRPATEDEIQNLIERAATGKAKLEVTREQVKEYWATGVERVATCTINCERYDVWFQQDLVQKAGLLSGGRLENMYREKRNTVPPAEKRKWLAKEKEEAKKRRRLGGVEKDPIVVLKLKKKAKKRGQSRSLEGQYDTEDEEEQLERSEDEQGDAGAHPEVEADYYIPRGTRSRPVYID